MSLTQRLDLKQSQSLVLTPQLQQAIKLLQYSALELNAFIETQIAENPLLEVEERYASPLDDNIGEIMHEALTQLDTYSIAESLDSNDQTLYNNNGDTPMVDVEPWQNNATPSHNSFSGEDDDWLERCGDMISLQDHLRGQCGLVFTTPVEQMLAHYLIDLLDEAGYLRTDTDELAHLLGCDTAQVDAVLQKLKGFDPAGVFARDLSECLKLQLLDRNHYDPAMANLLANLDLLAQGDIARLKKRCGVNDEDFAHMLDELKSLDPKPGAKFLYKSPETLIPDVYVWQLKDGGWQVELNNDSLPKVLINNRYYSHIQDKAVAKSEKDYVNQCYQSANWLVKSLHQRATTILKVAETIVREQEGFLKFGIQYMKPMVLKQVAEITGLHESTVSRVTNNKYIATPRGIFELKFFFASSIQNSDGDGISALAIKQRIKTLIDKEDPQRVLSDDALCSLLKAQGIDLARRTVAKYREALHIGSSADRRRQKAVRR